MTDAQDDDQWLYGDDGEKESAEGEEVNDTNVEKEKSDEPDKDADATEAAAEKQKESTTDASATSPERDIAPPGEEPQPSEDVAEGDKENNEKEGEEGEKTGEAGEGDSSDEDDFTITIGELKKAAEVMTPGQQHQARFQPKAAPTTGLKDDDFVTSGKVNGVPVAEFTFADNEDKPWRKPGADLTDYFNYGFNEQSWFKYCDRQKRMRVHESGTGLQSLGVHIGKPFGNLNAPYNSGGPDHVSNGVRNRPPAFASSKRDLGPPKSEGNTIQVMTADRREYSNKVLNPPPSFMSGPPPPMGMMPQDEMEFGGNPYLAGPDSNGYYQQPPTSYYNTPPPSNNYSNPPPVPAWNNPPIASVPPPPVPSTGNAPPPPRWGGDIPPPPAMGSGGLRQSPPPGYNRDRDRERERDRDLIDDEDRRRARRHRRGSRSPSRSRHRTRSRSRSPGHNKHKRKKSKRDRDVD